MMKNILNFALFQLGWFACILGAAHNYVYLALVFSATLILLHLKITSCNIADIKLFGLAVLIGAFFDGFLQFQQLILYNNPGWPYPLPPLWILCMWVIFAMTLNHSLKWMQGRLVLSVIFGLIGGPLAYIAGEKLGAISVASPIALYLLAAGWAIITPFLVRMAIRL